MRIRFICLGLLMTLLNDVVGQTLSDTQMRNARATGYAIVAARNPGKSFSILMIPWDGINTLDYNATSQINSGWHAQAAVKGTYFDQTFNGNDFSMYSSVVLSQAEFDQYKSTGTQWWIVCSLMPAFNYSISVSSTGYVGIGTTNPDSKLTVKGKIHAEEVKVDLSVPGPDYVFEPTYDLPTLNEVETYILQNKHLPEVPAAKSMEENGVNVGEMNMLLLKKVEELTLYLIELKKEIKQQDLVLQKLTAEKK